MTRIWRKSSLPTTPPAYSTATLMEGGESKPSKSRPQLATASRIALTANTRTRKACAASAISRAAAARGRLMRNASTPRPGLPLVRPTVGRAPHARASDASSLAARALTCCPADSVQNVLTTTARHALPLTQRFATRASHARGFGRYSGWMASAPWAVRAASSSARRAHAPLATPPALAAMVLARLHARGATRAASCRYFTVENASRPAHQALPLGRVTALDVALATQPAARALRPLMPLRAHHAMQLHPVSFHVGSPLVGVAQAAPQASTVQPACAWHATMVVHAAVAQVCARRALPAGCCAPAGAANHRAP